ncbi:MAG TPA: transcriptional regulator [Anaerolineae bacterium]|nr:transcriptional regulator [Anaerolineae bacterium]
MSLLLEEKATITNHWLALKPILSLDNEAAYERALNMVEALLDEVRENEQHPLYGLFVTLVQLIKSYEATHHPIPDCGGIEALQFLMDEHGLQMADLSELGGEQTVSGILHGSIALNTQQISALATRFNVSPAVFLG